MKALAVALALAAVAPCEASAQERYPTGAVAGTIVGAAIGGAAGYYYVAGTAATVIGIIAGGAIGAWWYTAAIRSGGVLGDQKMHYTDKPSPLFQLIDHPLAGLRMAAFSTHAD